MVKMIILGIIVTVATLAGAYAGLVTSQPKAPSNTNEQEPVEFVKLDATSVPIIRDGGIMGYVVVRAAFSASAKDVKQNRTSMTVFVAEALFKSIYAEQALNFAVMKPLQLDALREETAKAANARIGRDAIKQLAIESLSFLTVEEVRSQQK